MNEPLIAMLGGWEIAGIVVVVLVLFGAKKVPELMGGLGKGIKEFKKASREVQDEIQQAIEQEPPSRPAARPPSQSTQPRKSSAASASGTEDSDASDPLVTKIN